MRSRMILWNEEWPHAPEIGVRLFGGQAFRTGEWEIAWKRELSRDE